MKFNELELKKEIIKRIEELGYSEPTKVQEKLIPYINDSFDVLGQSQTGTGKTLAYAAGILNNIDFNTSDTKALIVTPTRELAIQVSREIEELGKYLNLMVVCVYGSSNIQDQIKKLKKNVDVVVGTPGRIKDLLKRRVLKVHNLKFFVLDEADEMLDMGFSEDLEAIFKSTNNDKQVLMLSATMPKQILAMAKKYMRDNYKEVKIDEKKVTATNVKQYYYLVSDKTRLESMCRIIDYYNPHKSIIFCKTKRNADDLMSKLLQKDFNVAIIHGDITQGQRIQTLDKFKDGFYDFLIATDVAARGIHVGDIDFVINYNMPSDNDSYVHRIGRTGRVEKSGTAITLVNNKEEGYIRGIERHINQKLEKKEIPSHDEIIKSRVSEITLDLLNDSDNDSNMFNDFLNDYDLDGLKKLCNKLLEEKLVNNLGSDFNKSTIIEKPKDKSKKRFNPNGVRVFLTIGKMDNIDKVKLLEHLEAKSNFKPGTFFNVEVLTKFTFMNVDSKNYDKFYKTCNNSKLNGKTIKIEKAKN